MSSDFRTKGSLCSEIDLGLLLGQSRDNTLITMHQITTGNKREHYELQHYLIRLAITQVNPLLLLADVLASILIYNLNQESNLESKALLTLPKKLVQS